ncbi:GDP-L-fucose synthase [Mycobacterium sp.]|uniref:GDP-L-fucose synthase family protein n=1 Tax=Mycobacterium sp. TaxID=1785 RepID=UPI00334159CC
MASGAVSPLERGAPVWVAGHRGLAGSAIWRLFEKEGFSRLIGVSRSELDLTDRDRVFDFVAAQKPKTVVVAAAFVGGILANATYPADFISRNLQIQVNVMDAATAAGVERLLFLGSSCIYPKHAPQPIKESYLHTGPLESTNQGYAVAKLAGIAQVSAVRRQHGLPWIAVMPSNLYGPGDNFHETQSHVLSALISRFIQAHAAGEESVTNWGTGKPRREFLYVDDLASACLHLLDHYNEPSPVNIGTGVDYTIAEVSAMVADIVGYRGTVLWDPSKPDGTPRKLLDVSLIDRLGWRSSTDIETGIRATVDWYQNEGSTVRC